MKIHQRIAAILNEYYGLEAVSSERQPGGWSALAFLVRDAGTRYFLKAYPKDRPSAVRWTADISRYIPLVRWLHDHTSLKNNIANPIFTKQHQYQCEDDAFVYLLSEYIDGPTIGDNPLNPDQVSELARILGLLHQSTAAVPDELKIKQNVERFEIDFCDPLTAFIHDDLSKRDDPLARIIGPEARCLLDRIEQIRQLSQLLQSKPLPFVLCHADAHGWNIIQGPQMVLLDWECLRLAPQEQDLILPVTELYAARFLFEYRKYMHYTEPDLDAFAFYYLKRKLEDIWEWIKNLRFEGLVKSETVTLEFLKIALDDCRHSNRFRSDLARALFLP